MPLVSVKLTELELQLLDEVVRFTGYRSRSEAIRAALPLLEKEHGLILRQGGYHARTRDRLFITPRRNKRLCDPRVKAAGR